MSNWFWITPDCAERMGRDDFSQLLISCAEFGSDLLHLALGNGGYWHMGNHGVSMAVVQYFLS